MKVEALINFKDLQLNKDIVKGDDLVEVYKKSDTELTKERIDVLLKGNTSSCNEPFVKVIKKEVKVETADLKPKVETADIKPKRKNKED